MKPKPVFDILGTSITVSHAICRSHVDAEFPSSITDMRITCFDCSSPIVMFTFIGSFLGDEDVLLACMITSHSSLL